MEEVANQSSELEVAPLETESVQEISQQEVHEEKQQDTSWIKQLRRDRDEAIRKSRMQEELIQNLMMQKTPYAAPQDPQEEDIIQELAKEEYVPGAKVAKGFKKLEEKFERKVQEIEKKYEQKQFHDAYSDLRREYPDLDEVVNPETLELVKMKNPRLANVWSKLDDYSIAVQAYPYIKNTGILEQINGTKRTKEVDKKIEQNKKTVQSPMAYEKRPLAQAFNFNNLSDAQKKELQKEMYQYASHAGGGY